MISSVHRMWITTFEEMRKSESKKKNQIDNFNLKFEANKKIQIRSAMIVSSTINGSETL